MLIALVLAVILGYIIYRVEKSKKAQTATGVSGGSAFARLAEAEGKIIALKVATEAKKAEAYAVHAVLDEVHSILG